MVWPARGRRGSKDAASDVGDVVEHGSEMCIRDRRAGFVEVSEERSDWAPDPAKPLKKFSPPRRVPHGVTLVGRLFDEGTICLLYTSRCV